jgi:hypothetical protein
MFVTTNFFFFATKIVVIYFQISFSDFKTFFTNL